MENEFIYVKDLRIFKNVKIEDMIIIDNSVLSFAFQLENGIPILPFYDNKDDIELKFLSNYLGSIYNGKDLRVENNRSIKMLYFLNAVKEKENSEMEENNNNNNFSIIKINANNNINNSYEEENSSFVSDPECLSQSTGKKEQNNPNSNSMFKISLFSSEGINNTNNKDNNNKNKNNFNDINETSGNNEASFSNSESSHNDSGFDLGVNNSNYDISNKLSSGANNKNSENPNRVNSGSDNNKCHANSKVNSENSNINKNPDSNGKRVNKRNNTFQESLFSTLDDLKKTFSLLSEKKRNNNNNL